MQIKGFQKLTLLDYPQKVACLIFTGGCNFRCPYCHNASLATNSEVNADINEDEIFAFLEKRKLLLDGVCITGGEPLMQPDVEQFVRKIKDMGYSVKVDTNGSYPDKLERMIAVGLVDYVAMDIKNCFNKYSDTVGGKGLNLEHIKRSIQCLLSAPIDFEFRTTVTKELHTARDIACIAREIKGAKRYYIQNYVQSDDILCDGLHPVGENELRQMLQECLGIGLCAAIRGE